MRDIDMVIREKLNLFEPVIGDACSEEVVRLVVEISKEPNFEEERALKMKLLDILKDI